MAKQEAKQAKKENKEQKKMDAEAIASILGQEADDDDDGEPEPEQEAYVQGDLNALR